MRIGVDSLTKEGIGVEVGRWTRERSVLLGHV